MIVIETCPNCGSTRYKKNGHTRMDAKSRQSIAFHVGNRSRESTKALGAKISEVYQQYAIFHTDQSEVYNGMIPAERHKAITKKARKTNYIARFNNTLRQRLARLVRHVILLQKGGEPHWCHQILHLPLQPGESSSIPSVALPAKQLG